MSLKKLIIEQKAFYFSQKPTYCPVLGETVHFTTDGWKHLLYKPNRKKRNVNEQFLKLKCLKHAPQVIEQATGIHKEVTEEKDGGKKLTIVVIAHEISKNRKIRVVIQKVGAGKYTFRSVMPHDRLTQLMNKNKKRHK